MRNNQPFQTTICDICGKEYIQPSGTIYKLIFADKTYHCCSYTCYQYAKRVKEHTNESEYRRIHREMNQ